MLARVVCRLLAPTSCSVVQQNQQLVSSSACSLPSRCFYRFSSFRAFRSSAKNSIQSPNGKAPKNEAKNSSQSNGKTPKNDAKNSNGKSSKNDLLTIEELQKLSLYPRFKYMFKNYWKLIIPLHFATSSFYFGAFYGLTYCGVDVVKIFDKIGFSEKIVELLKKYPSGGHFAVAAVMYKIVTPLRYATTLAICPYFVEYCIKRGIYIGPLSSTVAATAKDLTKRGQNFNASLKRSIVSHLPSLSEKASVLLKKGKGYRRLLRRKHSAFLKRLQRKNNGHDSTKH